MVIHSEGGEGICVKEDRESEHEKVRGGGNPKC
jgi:hypothetical protein